MHKYAERGFTFDEDKIAWGLAAHQESWMNPVMRLQETKLRQFAGVELSRHYALRNDINGELTRAIDKGLFTEAHLTEEHIGVMNLARDKTKHHRSKGMGYIKKDLLMVDVFYLCITTTKLIQMNDDVRNSIIMKKMADEKLKLQKSMQRRAEKRKQCRCYHQVEKKPNRNA